MQQLKRWFGEYHALRRCGLSRALALRWGWDLALNWRRVHE